MAPSVLSTRQPLSPLGHTCMRSLVYYQIYTLLVVIPLVRVSGLLYKTNHDKASTQFNPNINASTDYCKARHERGLAESFGLI